MIGDDSAVHDNLAHSDGLCEGGVALKSPASGFGPLVDAAAATLSQGERDLPRRAILPGWFEDRA